MIFGKYFRQNVVVSISAFCHKPIFGNMSVHRTNEPFRFETQMKNECFCYLLLLILCYNPKAFTIIDANSNHRRALLLGILIETYYSKVNREMNDQ